MNNEIVCVICLLFLDAHIHSQLMLSGQEKIALAEKCPPAYAVTPQEAINFYANKLTATEKIEIFQFPQIFFIGANAKKCLDNNGGYVYVAHDHIAYR